MHSGLFEHWTLSNGKGKMRRTCLGRRYDFTGAAPEATTLQITDGVG